MIKRTTIAVLCAVACAALLSRVNRTVGPRAWERGSDFLHTPINRIELDLTSLDAAATSITRATSLDVRIPPDRKHAVFTPPGSDPSARRLTRTNVTLTTVLDHLAAMPYSPPIGSYRVEGNAIVLGTPGERRPADDNRTF